MRIFNIKETLTCVLLDNSNPDSSKQPGMQPHYAVNIYPYCENDSHPILIDSLKNTLKNLNALCLQKPTEQNQVNLAHTVKSEPFGIITRVALAQKKKKVKAIANQMVNSFISEKKSKKKNQFKKAKKYVLKYKFYISNSDSSFPIFLLYEHETPELLTRQLAELLNKYRYELNANSIENLSLSKKDCQNESQIKEMYKDPHLKVLGIIADIFNEIEKQFSVNILGIFLDPYFISKKDNKLIADNVVDKRSSRIIELAIDDIHSQQIPDLLHKNTELPLSKIETNQHDVYRTEQQSQSDGEDIIFSTDSDSTERNKNSLGTSFPMKEEINKNPANDIKFVSTESIAKELELDCSQQDVQNRSISVLATYNLLTPNKENSSHWNPETKKKITNLLEAYQKHLATKYFFRSNDYITESKKFITTTLLTNLKSFMPGEFYDHVYGFSTSDILRKHRDTTIIQKIGHFFKRHNKTEGTLLLKNIFSALENNHMKDTLSV